MTHHVPCHPWFTVGFRGGMTGVFRRHRSQRVRAMKLNSHRPPLIPPYIVSCVRRRTRAVRSVGERARPRMNCHFYQAGDEMERSPPDFWWDFIELLPFETVLMKANREKSFTNEFPRYSAMIKYHFKMSINCQNELCEGMKHLVLFDDYLIYSPTKL